MNTEKTLKEPPLSLSQAWENEAQRWATWARKPGHDSYWQFHRDQFFTLLPEPGMLTVDVGCGEGRLSRDLKRRGHKVIGIDVSATLIRLAREENPEGNKVEMTLRLAADTTSATRHHNQTRGQGPELHPCGEVEQRI